MWEKSNKDQAAESSQENWEEGRSWREAELEPNGRNQRWNRRLQAVGIVLNSSQLGSQRQGTLDCLKTKEMGCRKTLSLYFKPKSPKVKPLTLTSILVPLMSVNWLGLMVEGVWSLKVEIISSFCVNSPHVVGFLFLLPGSFLGLKLLKWVKLKDLWSPFCF